MNTALSIEERAKYKLAKAACRKAVEGTVAHFRVLGERLRDIRGGSWWREEYRSWAEFCAEELPFGSKRADQLIRVIESPVANERQARELLGLEVVEQEAVLAIAESAGEVTAPALRSAREELEAATAELSGDERAAAIAELVEEAERLAAERKPAGASRRPRPPKDRRAAVERLVDRGLHFIRLARKEWQGLLDVVEANDADWYRAVELLEGIAERSRNSAELDQAA